MMRDIADRNELQACRGGVITSVVVVCLSSVGGRVKLNTNWQCRLKLVHSTFRLETKHRSQGPVRTDAPTLAYVAPWLSQRALLSSCRRRPLLTLHGISSRSRLHVLLIRLLRLDRL